MSNHIVCTDCFIAQSGNDIFKEQLGGNYVSNQLHGSLKRTHLLHHISKNVTEIEIVKILENIYEYKSTRETVRIAMPTTSNKISDLMNNALIKVQTIIFSIHEDATVKNFKNIRN